MLRARPFDKHLVPIDAHHVSTWSDGLRNACGNRTGAAANIQHRQSRPQPFGKGAVVLLKRSPPQDAGIGPV